jgi:acyl-CoA synthetase (NDP forming)
VAVVTNAGGLGILCADACEAHGLILAELARETAAALAVNVPREASLANPVDVLGSATADTYRAVLPALLADPHVDALIVLFVPPVVAGAAEVADAICETVAASGTDKPVIAVVISAEGTPAALRDPASPVAALPYPESAARALAFLAQRAEWLRRPAGVDPELEGIDAAEGRTLVARLLAERKDGWVEPSDLRTLLRAYGIPVVEERVAGDADAALEAAREIGYPVVVKTAAAGAHKTETGGVALDLADEAAVREAAARIGGAVLVQPLVRGGAELLAGVVQDPTFGPLVAFGPGGVFAELIGEASFRLAPLTDVDALELVRGGKAGRLVAGFRGKPAADAEALADLLLRLSRLAENHPELVELDLNPVLGLPDGAVAVDARARAARQHGRADVKGW